MQFPNGRFKATTLGVWVSLSLPAWAAIALGLRVSNTRHHGTRTLPVLGIIEADGLRDIRSALSYEGLCRIGNLKRGCWKPGF